jgi:hypothetical protein
MHQGRWKCSRWMAKWNWSAFLTETLRSNRYSTPQMRRAQNQVRAVFLFKVDGTIVHEVECLRAEQLQLPTL